MNLIKLKKHILHRPPALIISPPVSLVVLYWSFIHSSLPLSALAAAAVEAVVGNDSDVVVTIWCDMMWQVPVGTCSRYPYPQARVGFHVGMGTGGPRVTRDEPYIQAY